MRVSESLDLCSFPGACFGIGGDAGSGSVT